MRGRHRPDGPHIQPVETRTFEETASRSKRDMLAVEEPLEIQVVTRERDLARAHSISVTMRTPGDDFDLALGFLFTESVIAQADWVDHLDHGQDQKGEPICNQVRVHLKQGTPFDPGQLSRHVFTSSSCGICGRITIDQVRAKTLAAPESMAPIDRDTLYKLPASLLARQPAFEATGGLHASALFDFQGNLICLKEDVGRHNALDKVIGELLKHNRVPASRGVLMVSGRASFELVQKALMAGIPIMAAIGAPSSLAVDLAREFGMTLIGFLRDGRFNLYSGENRIRVTTHGLGKKKTSKPGIS